MDRGGETGSDGQMSSRSKGSAAEREVAKLLQGWWSVVDPQVEFARTPLSGGWQGTNTRGQKMRGEMRMSGDLMTTSTDFPYSVEVKRRESWSMAVLEAGRPSPVWAWWVQAQRAAKEMGLVPMLWIRQSNKPWFVLLPYEYAGHLNIQPPHVVWSRSKLAGVDYGALPPAMFAATTLLATDPARHAGRKRVA